MVSFFVVSRFSWSASRLGPRVQSSWSVVVFARRGKSFFRGQSAFFLVVAVTPSSWMVFIFYGGYAHVLTETYGWGKPRSMSGQMYGGG